MLAFFPWVRLALSLLASGVLGGIDGVFLVVVGRMLLYEKRCFKFLEGELRMSVYVLPDGYKFRCIFMRQFLNSLLHSPLLSLVTS